MALRRREPGLDDYAVSIVRVKARQMVRSAGFTAQDREDLEQELLLDLLRRLPRFDPGRVKRDTFIRLVVEHRVCTLLAARRSAERAGLRAPVSLDDEVDDQEGGRVLRSDTVDAVARSRRTGCTPRGVEASDLRLDVETALADLPPDTRALCDALRRESITEVARRTGCARGSIYDRLYRLRTQIAGSGLAQYAPGARRSAGPAGK